jgi:hypothetical protein
MDQHPHQEVQVEVEQVVVVPLGEYQDFLLLLVLRTEVAAVVVIEIQMVPLVVLV